MLSDFFKLLILFIVGWSRDENEIFMSFMGTIGRDSEKQVIFFMVLRKKKMRKLKKNRKFMKIAENTILEHLEFRGNHTALEILL